MVANKPDLIGGAKKWLFALMGKPLPQQESQAQIETREIPNQTQQLQDQSEGFQSDSVAGDIKLVKDFTKKGADMIKTYLTPFANKSTKTVVGTTSAVKSSVDNKFIKIAVRSFIVIFFIIILVFIASYLFGKLKEEVVTTPTDNPVITPTPASFNPYRPSVYANDSEILNLEEKIGLLEGDIGGEAIKESGINPPILDYNIRF